MANPEHLEILKQGVEAWNEWRQAHLRIAPDLRHANLHSANLIGANLSLTDLTFANLSSADLGRAHLRRADCGHADLSRAHLGRADLIGADLRDALLKDSDLGEANLVGANLIGADLGGARLGGAQLGSADLRDADLRQADFSSANLSRADFSFADLSGADFKGVVLGFTSFGDNDLSQVKGMETVRHDAPSSIGIDTIYKSRGAIPKSFLRGCGVPDEFITYMRSLVIDPIQFYSCFISYSSKDQEFAERLHADLQDKGVRVWFAPHDLPIGTKIRPAIDESIRLHDKLLLVLSEASVSSQWVEQEVETALAREREPEGKVVLFPVRIDDALIKTKSGWPALLRNTRNVGDFTRWKEHDSYQKAFDRLMRDLRAEEKKA
jgi:uncharacterized protein YjbI with pentapeptide repeats